MSEDRCGAFEIRPDHMGRRLRIGGALVLVTHRADRADRDFRQIGQARHEFGVAVQRQGIELVHAHSHAKAGFKIGVATIASAAKGIDTREDYLAFVKRQSNC